MSDLLDIRGDLAEVVDSLQPLTLRRRASDVEVAIPAALGSTLQTAEVEPSGGAVTQSEKRWLFELSEGSDPVEVGDVLVDPDDRRWTVLTVEQRTSGTQTCCKTQSLAIRYDLRQLITIEEATWEDNGSELEATEWTAVRTAIPARIQPVSTEMDRTQAEPTAAARFRVYLAEDFSLNQNHRLVDAQGTIYQIDRYEPADRIDALAVVEASAIEVASAP
ncbi:MAG: hypothetical protein AAGF31_01370 [Planctomycetota bacterium]